MPQQLKRLQGAGQLGLVHTSFKIHSTLRTKSVEFMCLAHIIGLDTFWARRDKVLKGGKLVLEKAKQTVLALQLASRGLHSGSASTLALPPPWLCLHPGSASTLALPLNWFCLNSTQFLSL